MMCQEAESTIIFTKSGSLLGTKWRFPILPSVRTLEIQQAIGGGGKVLNGFFSPEPGIAQIEEGEEKWRDVAK